VKPTITPTGDSGRQVRCRRPWTGFEVVDHLGDVRPCCWAKLSCGNVNDSTPEEIWGGPGFELYRERMAAGQTESICKPECPILLGTYEEVEPPARLKTPRYLRVAPTTACNLKCPTCYQLDDPPGRLPPGLYSQLEPWLDGALEFLVLGGEPFLSKECLGWFERLDTERYPSLALAAITNGLGFSPAVCSLIMRRRWSWILVSIDAASPGVFEKVRGGDFARLRENLGRLARARARSAETFELRLGFTLQNSNLTDAVAFLDLCEEFKAVPQYTAVFGDWHNERPRSRVQRRQWHKTLEQLDAELLSRGFSDAVLASVFGRLGPEARGVSTLPQWLRTVYHDGSVGIALRVARAASSEARRQPHIVTVTGTGLDRGLLRSVFLKQRRGYGDVLVRQEQPMAPGVILPVASDEPGESVPWALLLTVPRDATFAEALRITEKVAAKSRFGERPLVIRLDQGLRRHWTELSPTLARLRCTGYVVSLPYFDGETAVSARGWHTDVSRLCGLAHEWGWGPLLGGHADPIALGLECANQEPKVVESWERRSSGAVNLSVIASTYNGRREAQTFLASIAPQLSVLGAELLVIDDGSTDGTFDAFVALAKRRPELRDITILRLERAVTYSRWTFTFRAGAARQAAVERARGERVLFLDPDQRVEPGCLEQHLVWGARGFDVVIGVRSAPTCPGADYRAQYVERLRQREPLKATRYWWTEFFTGNSSVDREFLSAVGGFDTALQYWGLDDSDLGYRLQAGGGTAWRTPRAVVTSMANTTSGGGDSRAEKHANCWLHMEVLYRKYLDPEIVDAFEFLYSSDRHLEVPAGGSSQIVYRYMRSVLSTREQSASPGLVSELTVPPELSLLTPYCGPDEATAE
jgi:glycosyltransferase involved in cell wall biosynthesis/MoaA/NifB/PqqE/SkfB family radical SAM enzyme